MNQPKNAPHYSLLLAVAALVVLVASADHLWGQQTSVNPSASASEKPFLVEWVYKVKWGQDAEFWQIFKKYQIPVLNRQKELGYVISYTVYRPGYHTGEHTRWEYRIVIAYKNLAFGVKNPTPPSRRQVNPERQLPPAAGRSPDPPCRPPSRFYKAVKTQAWTPKDQ
jgi:hypothetical protein